MWDAYGLSVDGVRCSDLGVFLPVLVSRLVCWWLQYAVWAADLYGFVVAPCLSWSVSQAAGYSLWDLLDIAVTICCNVSDCVDS